MCCLRYFTLQLHRTGAYLPRLCTRLMLGLSDFQKAVSHVAAAVPAGAEPMGHHDGPAAAGSGAAGSLAGSRRRRRCCTSGAAFAAPEATSHTRGEDKRKRLVLNIVTPLEQSQIYLVTFVQTRSCLQCQQFKHLVRFSKLRIKHGLFIIKKL